MPWTSIGPWALVDPKDLNGSLSRISGVNQAPLSIECQLAITMVDQVSIDHLLGFYGSCMIIGFQWTLLGNQVLEDLLGFSGPFRFQ